MTPPPAKRPPRIEIQDVRPSIDCGGFPAKRTVGSELEVFATIFADGHDVLRAVVRYRRPGGEKWLEVPMEPLVNDRWQGTFPVDRLGRWEYSITAWIDRVASWRNELERKADAGQTDLASELAEGAALLGVEKLTLEQGLAVEDDPARREAETSLASPLELIVDRERAALRRLVRALPALVRRLRGRRAGAARARRARLRRPLLPADPSDRRHAPQGQEQLAEGRAGRSREPLGDRQRGRRPHRGRARARDARRPGAADRGRGRPRPRDRARSRTAVLPRPPVAGRASRSGSNGDPTGR